MGSFHPLRSRSVKANVRLAELTGKDTGLNMMFMVRALLVPLPTSEKVPAVFPPPTLVTPYTPLLALLRGMKNVVRPVAVL